MEEEKEYKRDVYVENGGLHAHHFFKDLAEKM